MLIFGDNSKDEGGHNDRWRALARLIWSPMAPILLQRKIAVSGGTETHECSAKYVSGLEPQYLENIGRSMSRLALRFTNLDGYWYAQSDTVGVVSAGGATTLTMPGDAQTRRMRITFSGGSAGVQTLTNSTNGCILSYNGATTTEVDLDVFGFTANQGGTNVMRNVTHAGDVFWMRLEPGVNALQFSGSGTVTVRAKATYL
jgi:phage-related protein